MNVKILDMIHVNINEESESAIGITMDHGLKSLLFFTVHRWSYVSVATYEILRAVSGHA